MRSDLNPAIHAAGAQRRAPIAFAFAFMAPGLAAQAGITLDGRIDAEEWADARHITDFRGVQPLTREPAALATEAWVKSTPEGLAIAFRNAQPAGVPRLSPRGGRDNVPPADRVNVYVDFDGDGRSGYNFMVTMAGDIGDTTIANENQFNDDWDGDWRWATSEDVEGWSAEILIPWHVAPMAQARDGRRTVGLSLDRVVGHSNARYGWPVVTWNEPRFLSAFERVEIPAYEQSLLAITPYVSGLQDQVGGRFHSDAGADLFWKPNGRFQLSATLNPDFGQVESDELVVNFGAVETFFNDKRPFFTENQAYFDIGFGGLGNANRLLYTRRVGAPADDGSGAGDVTGAIKLNGSAGAIGYGLFAATEDGPAGRDFLAARLSTAGEGWTSGAMLSEVKRPFLDRVARVASVDQVWTPNAGLTVRGGLVASDVDDPRRGGRDSGGQLRIDHELDGGWRQQLYALHLGSNLQLNDFGFLERNNFNYVRYEVAQRQPDLPAGSRFASHLNRYAISSRYNNRGLRLFNTLAVNQYSEYRNGGNRFWDVFVTGPINDDLVLRGNGFVRLPARIGVFAERYWARAPESRMEFYGHARVVNEGFDGRGRGLAQLTGEATYHASDRLRFSASARLVDNPDWVIWRGGDALGQFHGQQAFLGAAGTWQIDAKQELRLRLEAIGLDAGARALWRVSPDGVARRSGERLDDFALRNLGFQVRYRYQIAPLSDLYLAYVRGGSLFQESPDGFRVGEEFSRAFDLRDSEQLLIKLSYRFTI